MRHGTRDVLRHDERLRHGVDAAVRADQLLLDEAADGAILRLAMACREGMSDMHLCGRIVKYLLDRTHSCSWCVQSCCCNGHGRACTCMQHPHKCTLQPLSA